MRTEQSHAVSTVLVRGIEGWAKVVGYSSRKGLDGNHISFVQGDFVNPKICIILKYPYRAKNIDRIGIDKI